MNKLLTLLPILMATALRDQDQFTPLWLERSAPSYKDIKHKRGRKKKR